MKISPLIILVLAIAVGIAGAVVVVIFHSVLADVVGVVAVLVALAAVIKSTLRLTGELEAPDEPGSRPL